VPLPIDEVVDAVSRADAPARRMDHGDRIAIEGNSAVEFFQQV